MKHRFFTAASILLLVVVIAAVAYAFEYGIDFPGGQLVGKHTGIKSPQDCYTLCSRNKNCVAFTWVKPGVQGPTGVCWLKGSMSSRTKCDVCVSGVVRAVKKDICKWRRTGTTYSCWCQNSITKQWYQTNGSACPKHKPPPKYIDHNPSCPPGYRWVPGTGVLGQGQGGRCVKIK